jgi:hypothetical protein
VKFSQSWNYQADCGFVFISDVSLVTKLICNFQLFFFVILFGTVFSHNPCNDLHQRLRDIWILFKNFQVNFDCWISKKLAVFLFVILTDTENELVCEILSNEISSKFKNFVHSPYVPIFIWCKFFSQLVDFNNKIFPWRWFDRSSF